MRAENQDTREEREPSVSLCRWSEVIRMFYLGLLFLAGIIRILALGRKDGWHHHEPQQDPLEDIIDQIADDTDFLFPPDRTPEERRNDAELMLLMMMEEDLEEEECDP